MYFADISFVNSGVHEAYALVYHLVSQAFLVTHVDICKTLHLGMLNSISHVSAYLVRVFRSSSNTS